MFLFKKKAAAKKTVAKPAVKKVAAKPAAKKVSRIVAMSFCEPRSWLRHLSS